MDVVVSVSEYVSRLRMWKGWVRGIGEVNMEREMSLCEGLVREEGGGWLENLCGIVV